MYAFYTPILILQALCVYHAYRCNAESRWYWIILLLPLVGCFIYLYQFFNNRHSISAIPEEVLETVRSNYQIETMEQALEMTDNVTNRINLADVYVEHSRFDDAIGLYRRTLTGFMEDDLSVRMKLLKACYLNRDYPEVIRIGAGLEKEKSFANAEERIAYAWALHNHGDTPSAHRVFESMDKSFTNYFQRLEFCKFLKETNHLEKFGQKVAELLDEFREMKGRERKIYKSVRKQVEEMAQPKIA